MSMIREVLIDRQLSYNQAQSLLEQDYLPNIFPKSDASVLEEDPTTLASNDISESTSRVPQ